ncbi:hypothetical protein QVD17_29670 [Tagetes erecta]|uniref:Protein kinase domain-containing protein n=1 Tax=Tagetes erecta TaxID=13708 RepID=A0AAD8K202_TARER|nr:hypothetical protein QVD17_29670 [Tagetes erecta]
MSPVTIILLSLFILLHRVSPAPTEDLNEDEKNALLSFFHQVRPNPTYIWNTMEPPCKTPWKGVECDATNKTVWYLRLPAASLTGDIPLGTIGKLTSLRYLSLHGNHLKGSIPSDFSGLEDLKSLFLQDNFFSGKLPRIKALILLNVSNNNLSGPIPSSLSKFPESVFFKNDNLCGAPLRPCKNEQPTTAEEEEEEGGNKSKNKSKHLIVGISVGSGLLLLILVCCMRKMMYPQSKQGDIEYYVEAPALLAAGATTEERINKLVSLDDEIITNYDVDELLGASAELLGKLGSFGRTYKRVVDGKMTVVLKELKDVVVTKTDFESQMEVLGKMRNDNVVSLRAYCYTKNVTWLVYDYMSSGSLCAHLHGSSGASGRRFDWNHRLSVALGAAKGVAYLHASNVVHGNIKSSNIFLRQESDTHASVSDYGLSTLFGKGSPPNHRISGYLAPEVLTTTNFSFRSDVYSFGVLLLELLTRKTPNKASSRELWNEFHIWVQSVVREEQKDEIFDVELRGDQNIQEMFHMLRITQKCVSIVPHERPTMHELVGLLEEMPRVEIHDWYRQSSDDPSKGYEYTPSTDTRGTPSTITP